MTDFEALPIGTADRIKRLEAKLTEAIRSATKIGNAGCSAKLTKAMEALREIERYSNYNNSLVSRKARTTLAELEGKDYG